MGERGQDRTLRARGSRIYRASLAAAYLVLGATSVLMTPGRAAAYTDAEPNTFPTITCLAYTGNYGILNINFNEPSTFSRDIVIKASTGEEHHIPAGTKAGPVVSLNFHDIPLSEPRPTAQLAVIEPDLQIGADAPRITTDYWAGECPYPQAAPTLPVPSGVATIAEAPQAQPVRLGGNFLTTCGIDPETGQVTTRIDYSSEYIEDIVMGTYGVNSEGQVISRHEQSYSAARIATGERISVRGGANDGAVEWRIRILAGTLNTENLSKPLSDISLPVLISQNVPACVKR